MVFSTFVTNIENQEREMQVQRHHPPHQEEVSSMKTSGKWKKNKKEKKGKGHSVEGSIIDSSKLFNPNLNSIKTSSYSMFQTRSHRLDFMLDTGATCNFIKDRQLLTDFIEEKSFIWLADNSKTECTGHGTLLWKTLDINGKKITIILKKVCVIPTLHQNILSLSAIFKQYPNATEIKRDKNNLLLKIRNNTVEFQLKENLFKNLKERNSINVNAVVKTTNITDEEFRMERIKIAHLNAQDLAILLRSKGIIVKNETIKKFNCEECCKTKSTVQRPFNIGPIADKSIKNPGELIHSDIAGPEQSYNNKNYAMNLIDEVSGLVNVKFMKNKSEVSAMIKEGLREMRKLFRLPVPANATFQSDGEAIYKSKNVQNMLE